MTDSFELKTVTIDNLISFISSSFYQSIDIKPIAKERAYSQSKNPFANKNDIALVIAFKNTKLIGFVGFIPYQFTSGNKAYYNSGWWINRSVRCKNVGIKLFKEAKQLIDYPIFLTDAPDYTKKILSKTNEFYFLPPNHGEKIILRSYLPKYFIHNQLGRGFITFSSKIINTIIDIKLKNQLAKLSLEDDLSYKIVNRVDESLNEFIQQHSSKSYLEQSVEKINWIINNPWISEDKNLQNSSYPFSLYVKNFTQELIVINKAAETCGIVLINFRNGMATVPYYFCDNNSIDILAKIILTRAILQKINNIVIYDNLMLPALHQYNFLYLYKKNVVRHAGFSKELAYKLPTKKYFCDGDGDTAFT